MREFRTSGSVGAPASNRRGDPTTPFLSGIGRLRPFKILLSSVFKVHYAPQSVIPPDYALQSIPDDATLTPAAYNNALRYHDLPEIRTYINDF